MIEIVAEASFTVGLSCSFHQMLCFKGIHKQCCFVLYFFFSSFYFVFWGFFYLFSLMNIFNKNFVFGFGSPLFCFLFCSCCCFLLLFLVVVSCFVCVFLFVFFCLFSFCFLFSFSLFPFLFSVVFPVWASCGLLGCRYRYFTSNYDNFINLPVCNGIYVAGWLKANDRCLD